MADPSSTPEPAEPADDTAKPTFLTAFTATRPLRRLTRFSRVPAVARLSDVWEVAAERGAGRFVTVDRPPDIDPAGPVRRDYGGWADLVDEASAWLHAAGVRPWDRVAVMKANHLDVALLSCAVARLGAIPASFAWTHPPETVRVLLSRLERPFLVTDRTRLANSELDPATLSGLVARAVVVDGSDRPDVVSLDDLRGAPRVAPRPRNLDEPMIITHTSGTTGIPKLVLHSATSNHALAHVETERWPLIALRAADRVAFCDPYCHQRMSTAMLTVATVTPEVLALSDPLAPQVRDLLIAQSPTVVDALPNIYLAWEPLARDSARPFKDTRLYINSFDAIHTRTIRTFLSASSRRIPVWVQSWSQSENGAMVLRPYTRLSVRKTGRRPPPTQILGWPLPVCKVRTVDPLTGEKVPRGEVGLIEVSQPGRCLAYVGEQDRHAYKCRGDWWNTGDLGTIGRFDALRLVDREVDRIPGASGIELEDVLLDRLPSTTEVVVLAVPNGKPVPVVATAGNRPIDKDAWHRAVADLPPLESPIHMAWEDIPRTATWKVRRTALRKTLFQGAEPVGLGKWT